MGTPLPFEEDPQEGDVDDDDAVGEPKLGCQLRTVMPLGLFTRKPLLSVKQWDPPIGRGSIFRLRPLGQI